MIRNDFVAAQEGEQNRYHRLLRTESVGAMVLRFDDLAEPNSLRFLTANALAATILRVDLASTRGCRLSEVFPNLARDRLASLVEVVRQGTVWWVGADEEAQDTWSRCLTAIVPLGEGTLLALLEDVTARNFVERELVRSTTFLDSIVENIPAMVFVKDAQHLRFERFNRAGEDLLGLSRLDLLGKNDFDFFPEDQAKFFQAKDREVLDGGKLVDILEEPIDTKHGRRWLHTKKIPIVDERGAPKYLLGISEDVTERKRNEEDLRRAHEELETRVRERTADLTSANETLQREIAERQRTQAALLQSEEQLRHAQKMEAIGRLAGGVAHDFNNMLAVILSQVSMIMAELPPGDPSARSLEQVRLAGQRAAALTRQLLAFSRQQVMEKKPLDLNVIIVEMERMMRPLLGEDIELRKVLSSKLGQIAADRGHIEQVIMNLAVNARDALPNGGKLIVQTSHDDLLDPEAAASLGLDPGAYVVLLVSDDGIGMDASTLGRIFEPFFTTKERGKGTGLGLSTVYGIVQQTGGSISVTSEVGRGTTFKIYFPRLIGPAVAPAPQAPAVVASGGGGETILLVEDEDLVRGTARAILLKRGYRVLEAQSGAEALSICERYAAAIHMLVADVVMPNMSGRALAEQASLMRPDMAILYMSGYTDDVVLRHGVGDEGVQFIQKPFTADVLAAKVREVLAGRARA